MKTRKVLFGLVVVVLLSLCTLSSAKQFPAYEDPEKELDDKKDLADVIVGAWNDNRNRTVYVCMCWIQGCRLVYITVSEPLAPANTSLIGWGNWTIREESTFFLDGVYFAFPDNQTQDDPELGDLANKREFSLKEKRDGDMNDNNSTWVGWLNGNEWKLTKRIYKREPSPSICFKPDYRQTTSRVLGRWQRTSSTNDPIVVNFCPSGKGFWQQGFGLKGGTFEGRWYQKNMTWIGKRIQNSQDESTEVYSSSAFIQSGLTILTEVVFDTEGRFVERQFYSYVGGIDVVGCGEPNEVLFPIPYDQFSLFVYVGILVTSLVLGYFFPTGAIGRGKTRGKVIKAKLAGYKEGVIPITSSSSSGMLLSSSPSQASLMGSSSDGSADEK